MLLVDIEAVEYRKIYDPWVETYKLFPLKMYVKTFHQSIKEEKIGKYLKWNHLLLN